MPERHDFAAFSTFQECRMEVSQTGGQNLRGEEGRRRAAKLKILTSKVKSLSRGSDTGYRDVRQNNKAGGVCVCAVIRLFTFCLVCFDRHSSFFCVQLCCIYIFVHDILKLYVSGSSAGPFPKASCYIAADVRDLFKSPKHTSINKTNKNHLWTFRLKSCLKYLFFFLSCNKKLLNTQIANRELSRTMLLLISKMLAQKTPDSMKQPFLALPEQSAPLKLQQLRDKNI